MMASFATADATKNAIKYPMPHRMVGHKGLRGGGVGVAVTVPVDEPCSQFENVPDPSNEPVDEPCSQFENVPDPSNVSERGIVV